MRLRGFDYSQDGAYFITICTRDRACLLGEVVDGEMHLSVAGRVAQAVWEGTPRHYPYVRLDAWTIMPNHVHGVVLLGETGAGATSVSTDGERGANDHSAPVATVLGVKGYMGGVVGATQTVWFLQRALQSTSSLRMQAVRATSLGLPAATRRW